MDGRGGRCTGVEPGALGPSRHREREREREGDRAGKEGALSFCLAPSLFSHTRARSHFSLALFSLFFSLPCVHARSFSRYLCSLSVAFLFSFSLSLSFSFSFSLLPFPSLFFRLLAHVRSLSRSISFSASLTFSFSHSHSRSHARLCV